MDIHRLNPGEISNGEIINPSHFNYECIQYVEVEYDANGFTAYQPGMVLLTNGKWGIKKSQ